MKRQRLAFIGCGFVAQQAHLPCYAANKNFEITHIADPCVDLREKISKMYSIKNQFDSHLELLKCNDIDGFIVTLPRRLTFHVVYDLLNTGKFKYSLGICGQDDLGFLGIPDSKRILFILSTVGD